METVIQEEVRFEEHVEMVLHLGINYMLALLIGGADQAALVRSIQQLGARSPALVYGCVVEMLKAGAAVREQEELRRQIGFLPHRG
ncbi:MAG TPA: hypothetical protein VNN19_02640 [bacterium]|nr:hypothetical protein [bacterium]